MKHTSLTTIGLLAVAFIVGGCAHQPVSKGWVTLIDGEKGLENWNCLGGANWRAEGGAIVADMSNAKGSSFLVTKNSYKDFEIRAEFYAESNTNSGIFIRCADPNKIGAANAYEVNIWDTRPDPSYGTAAIVNVAKVPAPIVYKAGGKWNTFEIKAKGPELTVVFNGVVTVNVRDSKFAEGPIALQFAPPGGPIKWRKVQVRPL
ncbi:MAG: 3-keto-disaccharide hydrolase [Syntrophales bacterium]